MSFAADLGEERERTRLLIAHATAGWAAAMRAHHLAPPDAGFAGRLRGLSEAAATEQLAWEQADGVGMQWTPVPGSVAPPYELRPGTGRRGPSNLWDSLDRAVAGLSTAINGASASVVAAAFGAVAIAAAELARAVEREDHTAELARERTREIRAAAV